MTIAKREINVKKGNAESCHQRVCVCVCLWDRDVNFDLLANIISIISCLLANINALFWMTIFYIP